MSPELDENGFDEETLAAVAEGEADLAAGRVITLEEFLRISAE